VIRNIRVARFLHLVAVVPRPPAGLITQWQALSRR
jgi:hypothetical protein